MSMRRGFIPVMLLNPLLYAINGIGRAISATEAVDQIMTPTMSISGIGGAIPVRTPPDFRGRRWACSRSKRIRSNRRHAAAKAHHARSRA